MARNNELTPEDIDDNDPEAGSQLRAYIKRIEAEAASGRDAARRLAFAEAGIDTSSRKGQAFLATTTADVNDREAILADAQEFDPSIIRGFTPADATSTEPTTATEPTGSAQRTALADGALPSGAAKADPRQIGLDRGRELIAQGSPQDVAIGELIANLSRGVHEGTIEPLASSGRQQ